MDDCVVNAEALPWKDLTGLAGARGYEFVSLVSGSDAYTKAYSCELVRLGPADHSVPHTEPWNHALYFLEGSGELVIGEKRWEVKPGTLAKVRAGERHSLRNFGPGNMVVLTIYDPPRTRK